MAVNGTVVSTALVPVTLAVGTYTALVPELAEVRKSVDDPAMVRDVRTGEITASLIVLSVGAACSYLVDSAIPVGTALIAVVALVLMYESVLRMNPTKKGSVT